MEDMKIKDFDYTADRYGYMIKYKGVNLGGASVLGKPKMHYKHARQNVTDNIEYAKNEISKLISGNGQERFINVIQTIM